MQFETDISVWEKLKNTTEPIIMYGTGNGADKVVDKLLSMGITLSGVTASDTFVRSRTFRTHRVMPLSYFEETYENFTLLIAFGTSLKPVMDNIYSVARRHRTLVPCVPVIGTEIFDEDFLHKNEEEIDRAYSLMADDFSKKVFAGYINFLYGGELSILQDITSSEDEAFTDILKLCENETYVDIGAYRGDTVDTFLKYCGGKYNEIICAEPDTKSFKKLTEHCNHLSNFRAFNAAVTDSDSTAFFSNAHGRQSSLGGNVSVRSLTLDTLCRNNVPTYIKIDSEGCENTILTKGRKILENFAPKLNIAAYHKSADIFSLPIIINDANPDYKIHLRHHPYIPAWDTLFYCTV